MAAVAPPGFMQNLTNHTAQVTRSAAINSHLATARTAGSLVGRGGVNPTLGGGFLVTQNGTPNMSVNVASGQCFVPGTENALQGTYDVVNDGTVNLAVAAADPSNPRIDIVVVRVQDAVYSGASNTATIAVVTGTPAGSPAVPATPANSIVIAQLAVSAGDTSIVTGDITDRRPFVSMIGGIIPVADAGTRDALVNPYDGLAVWRQNTDWLDIYTGAAWKPVNIPRQGTSAGLVTAINSPSEGMIADAADINHILRYDSDGRWKPLPGHLIAETTRTAGDYVIAAGAHSVLLSTTFTAVQGCRYVFDASTRAQLTNDGSAAIMHIRHASGASITTGSTSVLSRSFGGTGAANKATEIRLLKSFVASASGSYTVGVTWNFFSGSGNMTVSANTNDEFNEHIWAAMAQ